MALNQDEEDVTFTAKSCDELVADAVEQTGWSQTAVNRKVAYDAIEEGENVLLLDPARTTVEENDVINMKVTAYDAEENKLGESYIGNVTGNKYEKCGCSGRKTFGWNKGRVDRMRSGKYRYRDM